MIVDGDVADVRDHHIRSNCRRVNHVSRIRVRHEQTFTGGGVAHPHAEERTDARIDDHHVYRLLAVSTIATHGLTTDRAREILAHHPFRRATLADNVSARSHAVQCLIETDSTLFEHFHVALFSNLPDNPMRDGPENRRVRLLRAREFFSYAFTASQQIMETTTITQGMWTEITQEISE